MPFNAVPELHWIKRTIADDAMNTHIRYWQDLTTEEFPDRIGDHTVALLPVAAIEQHGPHLPLSTDLIIGDGILNEAFAAAIDADVLILPTVTVGLSIEHSAFPGTLSLRPDTVIEMLVDLGRSVASSGVRRLVLFNSHGGNRQIIDLAALRLRQRYGMLVVKANYFSFETPTELVGADELAHGIHGGELETAMMLYLAPDSVRIAQLRDFANLHDNDLADNEKLGPEGEAAFAWMGQDLNPAGVVGAAAQATASQGQALVHHFAQGLRTAVQETARFNLKLLR